MTPKKAFERFLADQFLRAGSFAPSSIEDHESPDFIAVIDGERIGLEITQMFGELAGGGNKVSAEAVMHRIVGKAQRMHVESGARPAHVVVTFASNVDVRSLNRDEIARQLADVVSGLDLPPFETINAREWEVSLPKGIAFLHATGVPEYRMGHWHPTQSGWVEPMTVTAVQACIDEKAKLLERYRLSVPQIWLAIIVNGMRATGLVEVRPDFDPSAVKSPFDRTYFYRHPDRGVLRLGQWCG